MSINFDEAVRLFREYDRIIIHRHTNPDGDAIGSQTGLRLLLRATYPDKEIYAVGDPAGRYAFIPCSDTDDIPDDIYDGALAVVLDTSATHLISDGRWELAKETLRIDHHLFISKFCDTEIIDTGYESCAGLITDMARQCYMKMTSEAAYALYTGIVTDSGRFRYDSTSARTFELASYLMTFGIPIGEIYGKLYAENLERLKLRAEYIGKIKLTEHGVGYIYTTRRRLEATGAEAHSISRGMVGIMSDIQGIDIWVNFTECDAGVLCEIRSSKYNINPVAVKYGGGGHAKASGATLGGRRDAMRLLKDLDKMAAEGSDRLQ